MGQNDGGIKRGDRADTGDLQAQHKDGAGRKSETPSYPAVEHGDAEGYIDEEEQPAEKAKP